MNYAFQRVADKHGGHSEQAEGCKWLHGLRPSKS
jgi:hypothetical protein